MIVITGASDGLGKALTRTLSKKHEVIMLARSEDLLRKISQETGAKYIICDVRDAEMVKRTFERIENEFGTIDTLINNAGVIVNGELTDTDDESIQDVIGTNTTGAIIAAKYALQAMKEVGKGLIINVISQSGLNARGGRSIYNASKWAMTGFTKALQEEASDYGVRVTGFYPGTIMTKLFEKANIELTGKAMDVTQVVASIQYILDQPDTILIPQLEMRPF